VSYKLRNTVVLASVFLFITAAGLGYWKWWQPREIKKNTAEMAKIDKDLLNMAGTLQEVQRLETDKKETIRKYDSRSKEIPTNDISSQTYAYMSKGIDESGFLKFDMTFEGTKPGFNCSYNVYKLTNGRANFENIYKFAYYLENGRRLYKIRAMTLSQKEELDKDSQEYKDYIEFTMDIEAYFSGIDVLATSLAAKTLASTQAPFDPFHPLFSSQISENAPANQIDPNKLEIKAVLPGKAFALYADELLVLHVGDKVWRGSVTRINTLTSTVEFQMDVGGLFKKLEKKIEFDKKKRFDR
jgi:hypothetical protein